MTVRNDRSQHSICLCFDAASGLNTIRHMRVHATYWVARFPSPSSHTVPLVDDALQISHCFYSLFLFSRGQVRRSRCPSLPSVKTSREETSSFRSRYCRVQRRCLWRGPVIVPSGGCGHGGRGGEFPGGIKWGGESELGCRAPSSARVVWCICEWLRKRVC
jgi:hypothetical protein